MLTMLTICTAMCAVTMLAALADAACWAATANSAGLWMIAVVLVHGDGDVAAFPSLAIYPVPQRHDPVIRMRERRMAITSRSRASGCRCGEQAGGVQSS